MDYKDDFLDAVNNELAKIGLSANAHPSANAGVIDGPGMHSTHHRNYDEYEVLLPISFHGALRDFHKGIGTKWSVHPDELAKLKDVVGSGDFIYGNGRKYRMALDEARVKNLFNSSQVPVGIKFSGIPVSTKCIDAKCTGVDIMIPPSSNSAVDHVIYKSDWGHDAIREIINSGWGNMTKRKIEEGIINKGPAAWKLAHDSPIVSLMSHHGAVEPINLRYVQDRPNEPGYHLVRAKEAEKYKDLLHHELSHTPFNNPYEISASLQRMDTPQWSSTKIGDTINHPGIVPTTPEYIGANLHLKYKLYPVPVENVKDQ